MGKESKRYNKSPAIEESSLNNFVSFQPLNKERKDSPKFMDKNSTSKAGHQKNIKDSLRYSHQQGNTTNIVNNSNSNNKSVNKSFVINSRKTPSQSKDYRR